jgi:1-acyl-sn-glycerol-3-phosphate acyltransferase
MTRILKLLCLNVSFYILLVLFSLIAVPLLALFIAVQAPFAGHRRAMRLFRMAIRWYGLVVIYLLPQPFVRVRFENHSGGAIPDPCIVICNHRSSSDPFLMAVLPLDQAVQVVNTWPFRLPLWGPMAKWAGYLGVNDMPVEEFFNRASALLREGVSVIAFPEGTRTRTMEVGPFHGTLFRLALETKAPILPLCILGSECAPPRGTMVLRPGPVVLRSLPAVTWEEYRDYSAFQLKNKVRDMMIRELTVMESF